uniref:Uncharacterized protein n=1 Tax=Geospiza parvula TaxID=87175 RepID=A0A8U8C4W7_GEOPR
MKKIWNGVQKMKDRNKNSNSPSDDTSEDAVGNCPGFQSKHRVHYGQVPVQGQQDYEEDATVERLPKNPVVNCVISPKGERKYEQQIRNCQVEQVDVSHTFQSLVFDQDKDNKHVAYQAKYHH